MTNAKDPLASLALEVPRPERMACGMFGHETGCQMHGWMCMLCDNAMRYITVQYKLRSPDKAGPGHLEEGHCVMEACLLSGVLLVWGQQGTAVRPAVPSQTAYAISMPQPAVPKHCS
jgi:hypothetical protein